MITKTDQKTISFLREYKCAHTSTLTTIFYSSLLVGQRRLKIIREAAPDIIKVDKGKSVTSEYFYYYEKKQGQWRHRLLLTDFLRELHKIVIVNKMGSSKQYGSIIPDGLVKYQKEKDGSYYLAFLEMQRANDAVNLQKYELFYTTKEYKEFFDYMPYVFVISNRSLPKHEKIKALRIKEDLSNIEEVLFYE